MQNWFVKETCMQLLEDRKLSRSRGVRKPQLYTLKTKRNKTKQKNKKTHHHHHYHHHHHHQTPQLPLCPNPLDAEKKNATFGKKKYASYYLKMCKNAISFFSCKILRFIVIYKCKLWYKLTFL